MSNISLVYGLALHEFSVAQVDGVPAWCLGGHRFESCTGLKFFLCPMLMTCRLFRFHIGRACSTVTMDPLPVGGGGGGGRIHSSEPPTFSEFPTTQNLLDNPDAADSL